MTSILKEKPFIKLFLDKRRELKRSQLYPLCVRIKYVDKTRFYRTGLSYSEEEYKKIKGGKRLSVDELNQQELMNAALTRAIKAAEHPFSFEKFERAWYSEGGKADIYKYYLKYISDLKQGGKYSTADIYNNSYKLLKEYHPKEPLHFEKITPVFLKKYAAWMLDEPDKKSITTVSLYIRCIRTLFNQAIRNSETAIYPFHNKLIKSDGYKVPMPKKGKVPLKDADLDKIKYYIPTKSQQFWYDIFMFSYYAGGANIKDIAFLENKHFINNCISFIRAKTAEKNPEERSIPLTDEALAIIERWQCKGKYIFPLIEDNMSTEQVYKTIKSKIRNINKVMKKIALELVIHSPVSTYTARHTFANRLVRTSAPIVLISQALHHKNIQTTQNYIASFPDDEKGRWFEKL